MRRIQLAESPSVTGCTGSTRAKSAAWSAVATTSKNGERICLKPYPKVTLPESATVSPL